MDTGSGWKKTLNKQDIVTRTIIVETEHFKGVKFVNTDGVRGTTIMDLRSGQNIISSNDNSIYGLLEELDQVVDAIRYTECKLWKIDSI